MLLQYEPVQTVGSPEMIGAMLIAAEPPQPFTAVSSLTTINMQDSGSGPYQSNGGRHHTTHKKSSRRHMTSALLQRKRKQLKTRFSDLARSRNWKLCQRVLFLLGVLGAALLASFMILRFINTDEFNLAIQWIQDHEVVGSLVYVLSFTAFIILCFPSTAFELLAGYIFGFWVGLLLATIGKLLGSVLSFLIGRYLCRKRVRAYMERGHPVFKAFQSLLLKRQVLIVFLTRIAFFPIAIKNYGLSVLEVKFAVYFAAALITGLPFSIIWVYSGHAAQHLTMLLSSHGTHSSTEIVILIIGAVSALSLLFFIGFYTRKHILALAQEETEAAEAQAQAEAQTAAADDIESAEPDAKASGSQIYGSSV